MTTQVLSLKLEGQGLLLRLQDAGVALKRCNFQGIAALHIATTFVTLNLCRCQLFLRGLKLLLIDQDVVIELAHLQCNSVLCLIELSLGDKNILFGRKVGLVNAKQLSEWLF